LQILFGIATFIPGVYSLRSKKNGSGGSFSARYCYSVYLRHMVILRENNLSCKPKKVAELGPGDSIGIGIMSLLLGAEKYYAFDVVRFANTTQNVLMFDKLLLLLKNKTPIPGENIFPRVFPKLKNYDFPSHIFDDEYLDKCLNNQRLKKIRRSIAQNDNMIQYSAPWLSRSDIVPNSIDLIISQAVLEHVDDLDLAYRVMTEWLKNCGYMSHCIDFKSHGKSSTWDGHWKMSRIYWFLLRGKRPYLINRIPISGHKKLLVMNSLNVIYQKDITMEPTYDNSALDKEFKYLSLKDRSTSGTHLILSK